MKLRTVTYHSSIIIHIRLSIVNSSIANKEQIHKIGSWLKEERLLGEYRQCWSAKYHGFDISTFQRRCDGKRDTISILKTNQSTVFGGFTDLPWSYSK